MDPSFDAFVNVGDLLRQTRSEAGGLNLNIPQEPMSPGLGHSGQYLTVVTNQKKKPLEKKVAKAGSQNSGSEGFLSAMSNENGTGVKSGQDALNMDHGYFDFRSMPEFSADQYHSVYNKYKKEYISTRQSERARREANGGELAGEEMAELA